MSEMTDVTEAAEPSPKKPWFKRWWVWAIAAFLIVCVIGSVASGGSKTKNAASESASTQVASPAEIKPKVPAEFVWALKQAESYPANMSKWGVYDQLRSPFGGKFSAEAAQYAIDNVRADWNANALAKAKIYQMRGLLPEAIRDQLTSENGEKFTAEEADYAIKNLIAPAPPAPSPAAPQPITPGNGATALCNDGTYSYASHHQGACSHHGGVAHFYK